MLSDNAPFHNDCVGQIQESLCAKLGAFLLLAPDYRLVLYCENMVYKRPQSCGNDSIFAIWHSVKAKHSLTRQKKSGLPKDMFCVWRCRTKFRSKNNVCRQQKQGFFCFSVETFKIWPLGSPLVRIHEENVASIGPQNLLDRLGIKKLLQQKEIHRARFVAEPLLVGMYGENSIYLKSLNVLVRRIKKWINLPDKNLFLKKRFQMMETKVLLTDTEYIS